MKLLTLKAIEKLETRADKLARATAPACDHYWGTTFLYVPQCTGEPPIEFFFYDNHAQSFLSVMKKIAGKHRRKGDRS
jgi:hypothetical protein